MSSSALCHEVLAGASVASLISPVAARISAGAATSGKATRSNRFKADMLMKAPYSDIDRLFGEHRVDLIDQGARAALLNQRDQPNRRILFGIDRERGFEKFFKFRAVLRRQCDAGGERHVRSGRLTILQFDGASEMFASTF